MDDTLVKHAAGLSVDIAALASKLTSASVEALAG